MDDIIYNISLIFLLSLYGNYMIYIYFYVIFNILDIQFIPPIIFLLMIKLYTIQQNIINIIFCIIGYFDIHISIVVCEILLIYYYCFKYGYIGIIFLILKISTIKYIKSPNYNIKILVSYNNFIFIYEFIYYNNLYINYDENIILFFIGSLIIYMLII